MITHIRGADTVIDIEWTDSDDEAITPDTIIFSVMDRDGVEVLATTPEELVIEIADDADLEEGNYSYVFAATADGLATILSAGLLRVRNP